MLVSHENKRSRAMPTDWEVVPIEDIGVVHAGGTPSRSQPAFWGGSIPWVTPGELTKVASKWLVETRERITQGGLASSAAVLLPPNTLLVTTRATIGVVAIAGVPVATNQGFKNIVPARSVDPVFYYYVISALTSELSRLASGSTFDEISRRDFVRVSVPRPPLPEQHRIAEILDTADKAIGETEALISKLKHMKTGLMHDLLTRGLDERGQLRNPDAHPEQFKKTPLGRIPREWEVRPLGLLIDSAVDGPFGSNLKTEHYIEEPGVRVVRLQNIGTGYFNAADKAWVSEDHAQTLRRHQVLPGDLLVASLGDDNHPIARACIYPDDFQPGIVKADCFRLRLVKSLTLHRYVMHVLDCPSTRGDINLLGQGVTRDRVNLSIVRQIRLRVPAVSEQHRIAEILDAHDTRIRAEEAYRDKLKLQKKGLMDNLLTGKVRVGV